MLSFFKKLRDICHIEHTFCHSERGSKSMGNGSTMTKKRNCQSGSIMLEVIAVLALMGVMGAMLFRQISQRNQELHNVQMASEIRAVKEAFSAFIQADRNALIDQCPAPTTGLQVCDSATSDWLAGGVKSYLPNGWFDAASLPLNQAYHFSLWIYQQNDVTKKTILYGVIVPTSDTLPQTGWNFKRAARVALLIGADGGVYQDGVTNGDIAGSLGSWHIDAYPEMGLPESGATYAAMTAMDNFTPEYELPEGEVNLKKDWQLATRELHAWSKFTAGGDRDTCYDVHHDEQEGTPPHVKDDSIKAACKPFFLVDYGNGKVFVNHDLEVGQYDSGTYTTAATITQEGVIKQADTKGMTIDADGRIITNKDSKTASAVAGTNVIANERYVVDPAYTSNMNDIRLTSRGGARLSDILPTYILKNQKDISGGDASKTISIPNCPTGYKAALAIFPVSWDQNDGNVTFKYNGANITATSVPVAATTADLRKLKGTVSVAAGGTAQTVDVSLKNDTSAITSTSFPVNSTSADLTKLTGTANIKPGICVKISKAGDTYTGTKTENAGTTGNWGYTLGYTNGVSSCTNDASVHAIAQTYCVWNEAITGLPAKDDATECKAAGFTWDTTHGCRYVYKSCTIIDSGTNDGTAITNKAAVCKAAGCNWNGANCS